MTNNATVNCLLTYNVKHKPEQLRIRNAQRSFSLRISSSVNATKSAGNCGFGHIYSGNQ